MKSQLLANKRRSEEDERMPNKRFKENANTKSSTYNGPPSNPVETLSFADVEAEKMLKKDNKSLFWQGIERMRIQMKYTYLSRQDSASLLYVRKRYKSLLDAIHQTKCLIDLYPTFTPLPDLALLKFKLIFMRFWPNDDFDEIMPRCIDRTWEFDWKKIIKHPVYRDVWSQNSPVLENFLDEELAARDRSYGLEKYTNALGKWCEEFPLDGWST